MAAPLVEYDSDEEASTAPRAALPPLELEAHSRLQGRLCHVFVRVAVQGTWLRPVLRSIIEECSTEPTFHPVDEYLSGKILHVSLIRPVIVAHHELDAFVRGSTQAVQSSQVHRFSLAFSQIACLPSDTSERVFLCLIVGSGWHELHTLSRAMDDVVQREFGAKKYYEEARYHASFGYLQPGEEPRKGSIATGKRMSDRLEKFHAAQIRSGGPVKVTHVGIQVGHLAHWVPLAS